MKYSFIARALEIGGASLSRKEIPTAFRTGKTRYGSNVLVSLCTAWIAIVTSIPRRHLYRKIAFHV